MANPAYAATAVFYSLVTLVTFLMFVKEVKGRGHYMRALTALACTAAAAAIAWSLAATEIDAIIEAHPLWTPAPHACAALVLFPIFAWSEWYVDFWWPWLKKRDLSSSSQKEVDRKASIHYPSVILAVFKWFYLTYLLIFALVLLYLRLKAGGSL
jgi:hypothetical protein